MGQDGYINIIQELETGRSGKGVMILNYQKMNYEDLLAIVDKNKEIEYLHGGCGRSSLDNSRSQRSFYGTKDIDHALDLARNGWAEGITKIRKVLEESDYCQKLKGEAMIHSRHEFSGNYVDIGRYLTGEPKNMIINDVMVKQKKYVTIIAKLGFSGSAGAEDYFSYGSKIITIIDFFESQGIRVELIIRVPNENGSSQVIQDILVKEYRDFLDFNKIVFAVCNPSFQRRLIWGFREQLSEDIVRKMGYRDGYGYGRPADYLVATKEEDEECLIISGTGSKYFNKNDLTWYERFIINHN